MLNQTKSAAAFAEAKKYMPGGVNSPVRSYANVNCTPPFIDHGLGDRIFDIDGNEYIDYVGSWGPLVVGHAHPQVVQALKEAVERGTSYGAPTVIETELAKKVHEIYPNIEVIRMVNSGTEATMSAGHSDSLLVSAGSGMATFGVPSSPGVTRGTAADTIAVPYNDPEAITKVMDEQGDEIAAIIVEPVAGNMGCVPPRPGFLQLLRELTAQHGTLLIFDEVMCGFRVSLGGAQGAYDIKPDLTCLGKIIGGGLPVAAYGGREEIMRQISPDGPVYQAGTLSGNPLAMTAGLETLKLISADGDSFNKKLEANTTRLLEGWKQQAQEAGVAIQAHQAGSMFGIFFSEKEVWNYDDSAAADQQAFAVWFRAMLEQGIYLAPSQFETLFMSGAHTDADIDRTIAAAGSAFAAVAESRRK